MNVLEDRRSALVASSRGYAYDFRPSTPADPHQRPTAVAIVKAVEARGVRLRRLGGELTAAEGDTHAACAWCGQQRRAFGARYRQQLEEVRLVVPRLVAVGKTDRDQRRARNGPISGGRRCGGTDGRQTLLGNVDGRNQDESDVIRKVHSDLRAPSLPTNYA